MSFTKKIFTSLLITLFTSQPLHASEFSSEGLSNLLSASESISKEDLEGQKHKMAGSWLSTSRVSIFHSLEDSTYVGLEYWGALPKELSLFAHKFKIEKRETVDHLEYDAFVYHYGDKDLYATFDHIDKGFPVSFDGLNYIWKPVGSSAYRKHRSYTKSSVCPSLISTGELYRLIQDKKIIFYTGTGFGKAAGVPSRADFTRMLGLDRSYNVDDMVRNAITNPEEVIKLVKDLQDAMYKCLPTKAHYSLATFARQKECRVLCDNDDFVLEKTGLKPLKLYDETRLHKRISLDSFKDVEVVICLGLKKDHIGLLTLFKELNPDGRIVAVDLSQPSYLDDNDLFLQGDINQVFPDSN